jgi:hypothetical protein
MKVWFEFLISNFPIGPIPRVYAFCLSLPERPSGLASQQDTEPPIPTPIFASPIFIPGSLPFRHDPTGFARA